MEPIPFQRIKASHHRMRSISEDIFHFSLQGMLPVGHLLAVNVSLGTLSHLVSDGEYPRLLHQRQFTSSEMSVLLPLLNTYPHYCSHAMLLASFQYGHVDERAVETCHQYLLSAREEGILDQELRAMRNVLSRMRLKLRDFGFEISAVVETGYIMYATEPRRKEA